MDDLTNQWSGLSISNREGLVFKLAQEMVTTKFIITTKFFTKQALNIDAIASTFKTL